MKEFLLKYGCNPNQQPARIYMEEGELPLEVLNGRPGLQSRCNRQLCMNWVCPVVPATLMTPLGTTQLGCVP